MQRFDVGTSRLSVDLGSSSTVANLGPGTVSYADSEDDTAQGTIASGASATLSETRYLWADVRSTVRIVDLTPGTLELVPARVTALESGQATQDTTIGVINAAYIPRSKRPVHVKDQAGFVGDGTSSDAAAFTAAVTALPSTGGTLALPATAMVPGTAIQSLTKNGVHIVGESKLATTLKVTASSGYLIDVQAIGHLVLKDFAIDGTPATGTAKALRLGSGTSRNKVEHVLIWNFTNTGQQVTTLLEGSLDNTFLGVEWQNNGQHLYLTDNAAHTYPSNQNVFADNCKWQSVQWASGSAIVVQDSEGNIFENFLCQGNLGANTIAVINTALGNAPSRGNQFIGGWMEENGNSQVGSHGFHIAGTNSTTLAIDGTIIERCFLFSSAHDNPAAQIYLTNAKGTAIDGCYSNLGSPNAAVAEGAGVTNTHIGPGNNFAGTVAALAGNVQTVASATTTTLPTRGDLFTISGTTAITSVMASWAGRRATLVFSGALTFTDGSNLKLAGNLVTTADDTISLISDGTNWIETGRSVN